MMIRSRFFPPFRVETEGVVQAVVPPVPKPDSHLTEGSGKGVIRTPERSRLLCASCCQCATVAERHARRGTQSLTSEPS